MKKIYPLHVAWKSHVAKMPTLSFVDMVIISINTILLFFCLYSSISKETKGPRALIFGL